MLDVGSTVSVAGSQVVFDCAHGADALAFQHTGHFSLGTFVLHSDGTPVPLAQAFQGDGFV